MPESAPAPPPPMYNYPAGVMPGMQGAPGTTTGGSGAGAASGAGKSPQTAGAALVGNLDAGLHSVV